MGSIITRIDLLEKSNTSFRLYGQYVESDGWELSDEISLRFEYYKTADGVETKSITGDSTVDGNLYNKFVGNKEPYTSYTYRAKGTFKKWNEETEQYDYKDEYGDWEEFRTDAYATTTNVFACNINKSNGSVTFYGDVAATDGYIDEVGFEYGTSKSAQGSVSLSGNRSTGLFSIQVNLSINLDYYVRGYIKTSSGHYFYTGDGEDSGWQSFSTKVYNDDFAILFAFQGHGFIMSVDKSNGKTNNTWIVEHNVVAKPITLDMSGIAYYGYGGQSTTNYIGRINIKTGEELDSILSSGMVIGIAKGYGNYIFTLELDDAAGLKRGKLYQRNLSDLSIITQIDINDQNNQCTNNIFADEEGGVYVPIAVPPPDIYHYATYFLEKYGFYGVHNIVGLNDGLIEIIADYGGTLWQWDYSDYEAGRNAENASYIEDDYRYIYIGQGVWNGYYNFMRVALFFDTSGISTIVKAELRLYKPSGHSGSVNAVIQNGMPDYPHNPLVAEDYNQENYSGNGGEISTSGWSGGSYKSTEVNKDWVNKSGHTKLLLRDENDINGVPSSDWDELSIAGHLWETEEQRPKLRIYIDENYFKVSGNYEKVYPKGTSIEVKNSTDNNGTYTVSEDAYFDGVNTIIPVEEKIKSEVIDGTITRVGNGELINSIQTPVSDKWIGGTIRLVYGGIAVRGNNVYAGAYFDYPVKADKELNSIAIWQPPGSWYDHKFWEVGYLQGIILVCGTPYVGATYAISAYDENDTQLWQRDLVTDLESINGCPFMMTYPITLRAERKTTLARVRLYGELP